MPQIIVCPDCDRKLRVPEDLLGKKVRCPGCSVMFKAVIAGGEGDGVEDPIEEPDEEPARRRKAPARDDRYSDSPRSSRRRDDRDDDEDDRPRRRRSEYDDDYERGPSPRDQKAAWGKVRIGINLVMIGTWVWLAGAVLGLLGGLLGAVMVGGAVTARSSQTAFASGGFALILLGLSVILYRICQFAELVLRAVGFGLCMAVPSRRGTGLKPLAITAFALACVDAMFTLVNMVVGVGYSSLGQVGRGAGGLGGLGLGLGFFLWLTALASVVVFLFFLRSVCNNIRAKELAGRCLTMAIVIMVYDAVKWIIIVLLIFATIGGAFFAIQSASQSQSFNGTANTMGAMVITAMLGIGLLTMIYFAVQVWYILLLKNVRDEVVSHRRSL